MTTPAPKSSAHLARPSRETVALVESVRDYAILMLDPQGTILTWNEGARLIKGLRADEAIGTSFTRFYTPEDLAAQKPRRLLDEAAAHGRVEDLGWRVRKDGTRFWADVVITALREDDGSLRGFVKVVRDLTEARAAEQRLRESEERFRLLVSSVKDHAIFMLDPEGRVATWNAGAEALKGWTASEIVGRHVSTFYPPEAAAAGKPAELLAIARTTGRVEDEGWRVRKDGTRFWADVVISPIVGDDGRLRGYAKVTRDLSERRAAEEALRASEERTRLMIASVRDYAIFMLGPDGHVATWNAGAERLKGYTPIEAIGRHFEIFYPEEDRAMGKPQRELEIAERDGRYEEEGWRVRKDGTRFWASVVLSAVRDEKARLIGFTKVTRDQTEQRRIARRLEARARQQAVTSALGLAALRERDFTTIADRVVHGVRDVLGTELVALLTPEGDDVRLFAAAGFREGSVGSRFRLDPSSLAFRVLHRREPVVVADFDGASVQTVDLVRAHGARSGAGVLIPAPDPSEPPYGALLAFRTVPHELGTEDVSFLQGVANVVAASIARRRDEEQLRAAELATAEERARVARAEQAVREREEFISIASHELRTPLNALHLNLHALSRTADLSPFARTRVEGAVKQSRTMAALVERLLDVTRIAAGKLEMVPEPMDLHALTSDVVEGLRETAAAAHTPLALAPSGEATGVWDRTRILQVVTNLVSNAIKYGGGKPVAVRVEADDRRARVIVEDQGIGIAKGDVDRIFGRFERAVSVRNFGGLGLGLYVARHIAEAHGGSIKVDSEVGRGSRFTLELPRLAHANGSAPPEAAA